MGINYNTLPEMFKKGTVLRRDSRAKKEGGLTAEEIDRVVQERVAKEGDKYDSEEKVRKLREKMQKQGNRRVSEVTVGHQDMIGESFWQE